LENYYLNVVDFIPAATVFIQDSAPSHHAKATRQFLRENRRGFIAADD